MKINSFAHAEAFLHETVPKTSGALFIEKKGLDKSARFFERLGNIQNMIPAVHVAATSGKGTVVAMIEALLLAHGQTVAALSSPHVYSITERTRINGQQLPEEDFVSLLNQLLPTYEQMTLEDDAPTYFEMNVAIGFLAAQRAQVNVAVVETGLGGLLDTTNTIAQEQKLCVIGQIGLDHTKILGKTLEAVAAQKAGIIQKRQHVVALRQDRSVNAVIEAAAKEKDAQLHWVNGSDIAAKYGNLGEVNPRLSGAHQLDNLALAIKAIEILASRSDWRISGTVCLPALAGIALPGRFEIIKTPEKTYVFDGAHNQQKITATLQALHQVFPGQEFGAVFASGQLEEAPALVELLSVHSKAVLLTEYHSKSLDMYKPAFDFTEFARTHSYEHLDRPEHVAEAINSSGLTLWLVTGSFYGLGPLKKALIN